MGLDQREIGTLFKPEMVRAVLANDKTQTRRIAHHLNGVGKIHSLHRTSTGHWAVIDSKLVRHTFTSEELMALCPHGKLGDRLLVREAHYQWGWWSVNGTTASGKPRMEFHGDPERIVFEPPAQLQTDRKAGEAGSGWWSRNSLFMPKAATRIRLEITHVRVEPLVHISEEDAVAEGILRFGSADAHWFALDSADPVQEPFAASRYRKLWMDINGVKSWEENPLVWVISFRKTSTS